MAPTSRPRVLVRHGRSLSGDGFAGAGCRRVGLREVHVTAVDFRFKNLPARVASGAHTFTLVNRGQATHDLKLAGKKTKVLKTGERATLKVTLKKGTYAFLCTVPGHAALGMKGKLVAR